MKDAITADGIVLLKNFHFSRERIRYPIERETGVFIRMLFARRKAESFCDSQYQNRWNAPGIGWLVRDVVFLDLLDLAGAPRHAHRRRVQEHHRYIFRDAGNTCHRAYEQSRSIIYHCTAISVCRDASYIKTITIAASLSIGRVEFFL